MSESAHLPLSQPLQEIIAITGKLQAEANLLERCVAEALKKYHEESALLNNADVTANFTWSPPTMTAAEWAGIVQAEKFTEIYNEHKSTSIENMEQSARQVLEEACPPLVSEKEVDSVVEAYKEEPAEDFEDLFVPQVEVPEIFPDLAPETSPDYTIQEIHKGKTFADIQREGEKFIKDKRFGLVECAKCGIPKARRWVSSTTGVCTKCDSGEEPSGVTSKKKP